MAESTSERGAALVETALLSVFLLLMIGGILDVGRAIFTRIAIEDAAQAAASLSAFTDPLDVGQIQDRVISAIDSPTLTDAMIDVTCEEDTTGARDVRYVTVAVTYPQTILTPAISIFTDSIDIGAASTAERFVENLPTGCAVSP